MKSDTQLLQADNDLIRSFSFLLKAYDFSSENTEQSVPIWEIGSIMGLSEAEAEETASDLEEMNLVYYSSLAGDIALTSFGMSEIVLAQSQPQLPTTHFPPLASMSPQMMLPLSVGADQTDQSVLKLVDQLESFRDELISGQGECNHLLDAIAVLESSLQETKVVEAALIAELETIYQELL